MENKQQLFDFLEEYEKNFVSEAETIAPFRNFLLHNSDDFLYSRKNFNGHITTSAFIINPEKDKLLLLKHKFLNRWLQPGGHVDETDDCLMAAAIREAEEETGITSNYLTPVKFASSFLFDIDSHPIPENKNKNEAAHIHHDLRFLFVCTPMQPLQINSESLAISWVNFSDILTDVTFKRVIQKVQNFVK